MNEPAPARPLHAASGRPAALGKPAHTVTLNETLNSLSHGIGAILAVAGVAMLLRKVGGDATKLAAFAVYGATMIALYTTSTALHLCTVSYRTRRFLRRLDHTAIYLFIAGTHTPLCVITLDDATGWALLGTVWTFATAGIFLKLFYLDCPCWLSVLTYWATGWLAVLLLWPLSEALSLKAVGWLVLGGAFYFAGSLVYTFRRPNPIPGRFGHHEIWHMAVLAGSACHFWLMWRYVA